MNQDQAIGNLYPSDEMTWAGFQDALSHKEFGIFLVDNDDLRIEYVDEANVVRLPPPDQTINWNVVAGWGFPVFTLSMKNTSRLRGIIQSLIRLPKPPHIIVRDRIAKADMPPYEWIATSMIRAADGDQEALLERAYEFDSRATDLYEIGLLAKDFWPKIKEALNLENEELLDKYEAYEYKRKQRDGDRVMRKAISDAQKKLADNDAAGAQAVIYAGYKMFQQLCKDSTRKPLTTAADTWDTFAEQISAWRSRDIIGFRTDMRLLTACLLGLRGLIVLAAAPNLGKTMLALQCAISALQNHEDACCLFLSLEMHRDELLTRAACAAVGTTWKDFVLNGSDDKIAAARSALEPVLPRLSIMDRDEFDGGTTEILQLITDLKTRTGCKRVIVVLDYIQVFEVPLDMVQVFHSDIGVERWRMEELKRLKLTLRRDDAIIAISEIRKGQGNTKKTTEDLMGSARIGYGADTVLIWQDLTTKQKWQHFSESTPGVIAPRNEQRPTKDVKKEELQEHASKVDEWCSERNLRYAWLDITKSRDGTIRRTIPITARYDKLTIGEGFVNGTDGEAVTPEGATNGNGLDDIFGMDEGALQGDSEEGEA